MFHEEDEPHGVNSVLDMLGLMNTFSFQDDHEEAETTSVDIFGEKGMVDIQTVQGFADLQSSQMPTEPTAAGDIVQDQIDLIKAQIEDKQGEFKRLLTQRGEAWSTWVTNLTTQLKTLITPTEGQKGTSSATATKPRDTVTSSDTGTSSATGTTQVPQAPK